MNPQQDTKVNDGTVDYRSIIDKKQAEAEKGQILRGELLQVGTMNVLAPNDEWEGAISAKGEAALSSEARAIYYDSVLSSIQRTEAGSQVGCMDGRWLDSPLFFGPKTAGGTVGNAARLMLASHAYQPGNGLSYFEALEIIASVDKGLGFEPGGHELGQCGAFKFLQHAILTVAERPELVQKGTETFLGALGQEYSPAIQTELSKAARTLAPMLDNMIPTADEATDALHQLNPNALPPLAKKHLELCLVVFSDTAARVNNNKLIKLTTERLGREAQAFGYNWGYHIAVANQVGSSLGAYYLQSVPSQDVPVLMKLTDGSLDIVAFKAA